MKICKLKADKRIDGNDPYENFIMVRTYPNEVTLKNGEIYKLYGTEIIKI